MTKFIPVWLAWSGPTLCSGYSAWSDLYKTWLNFNTLIPTRILTVTGALQAGEINSSKAIGSLMVIWIKRLYRLGHRQQPLVLIWVVLIRSLMTMTVISATFFRLIGMFCVSNCCQSFQTKTVCLVFRHRVCHCRGLFLSRHQRHHSKRHRSPDVQTSFKRQTFLWKPGWNRGDHLYQLMLLFQLIEL